MNYKNNYAWYLPEKEYEENFKKSLLVGGNWDKDIYIDERLNKLGIRQFEDLTYVLNKNIVIII